MDAIAKILLDIASNADHYKIDDDIKVKLKALIGALSTDPQSKVALEKASASFDQAKLAKFLA